ncbi:MULTISPECIES: efflux RND transporter periplasmic adaptor subunit [Bacillaceae]|uniref:efflux RND transporter periplasmic adaptor subunit n=1 Tax=Bacillaceae TaxID=186817 RepID=UPI000E76A324|nr:efflux RND transporter periplasmic adaptor subunit [Bacillus sp. PK3_68]RJS60065.1 multidrug efflux protein [Bacillus sp. PK3_68]
MNVRRIVLLNVLTIVILIGGGFLGYYFFTQTNNYIKTDNAKIDGQQMAVAAPAAGKLVSWNGEFGEKYKAGEKLGEVETQSPSGTGTIKVPVTLPQDGTIVEEKAVKNSMTAAGTPLAYAYDLNNLWITANVDETKLEDLSVGEKVDIYVDAYPDTTLTGKVKKIGLATANVFSMLPSSNSTANYTKVTQVVPVTISINDQKSLDIVPGMNVSVRIHK